MPAIAESVLVTILSLQAFSGYETCNCICSVPRYSFSMSAAGMTKVACARSSSSFVYITHVDCTIQNQ